MQNLKFLSILSYSVARFTYNAYKDFANTNVFFYNYSKFASCNSDVQRVKLYSKFEPLVRLTKLKFRRFFADNEN